MPACAHALPTQSTLKLTFIDTNVVLGLSSLRLVRIMVYDGPLAQTNLRLASELNLS